MCLKGLRHFTDVKIKAATPQAKHEVYLCYPPGTSVDITIKDAPVELVFLGMKTGLDISKAFAIGELSKGHTQILVETGKFLDLEIAVITINALMKDMKLKMLHERK